VEILFFAFEKKDWERKAEKAAQKNVKLLFDAVKLLPQKAT
jgi:hypothetical protein